MAWSVKKLQELEIQHHRWREPRTHLGDGRGNHQLWRDRLWMGMGRATAMDGTYHGKTEIG